MLIDQDSIRNFIIEHSKESFPDECCGLIYENDIVRCENSAKNKLNRFKISNQELKKNGHRGKLIAFYHSHDGSSFSHQDYAVFTKLQLTSVICNIKNFSLMEFSPTPGQIAPILKRPFISGKLDCVELIKDVYKKELNIDIPDFNHDLRLIDWENVSNNLSQYEEYNKENITILKDFYLNCGFFEIQKTELSDYDLILFRFPFAKTPSHVMMFRADRIIHHPFNSDSVNEEYNKYYQKYSVNYLRHKDFK